MKLYDLVPAVLTTFDESVASAHINSGRAVLDSTLDIPLRTISSLCREVHLDRPIDFLTVDCEGFDLNVLKGLDWVAYAPTLVCVETGGLVMRSGANVATEGEIHDFMVSVGYRVLAERGCNTLFERAAVRVIC
jgi:hypothetical protein